MVWAQDGADTDGGGGVSHIQDGGAGSDSHQAAFLTAFHRATLAPHDHLFIPTGGHKELAVWAPVTCPNDAGVNGRALGRVRVEGKRRLCFEANLKIRPM